jgi:hypothetical protein
MYFGSGCLQPEPGAHGRGRDQAGRVTQPRHTGKDEGGQRNTSKAKFGEIPIPYFANILRNSRYFAKGIFSVFGKISLILVKCFHFFSQNIFCYTFQILLASL